MIAPPEGPRPDWRPLTFSYSPRGRRGLRVLAREDQLRIAVGRYAATGRGDVKRLTDVRPPLRRLRVGDWRVLLSVTGTDLLVERIANRKDAY